MTSTVPSAAEGRLFPAALDEEALLMPWPPREVLEACRHALRRIDGPALSCIGVTSCHAGEGRSTVAAAIAAVQRFEYGRRTVLVELDLAAPSLTEKLKMDDGPGVVEVLRGESPLEKGLRQYSDGLLLLTAGNTNDLPWSVPPARPTSELLDSLCPSSEVVVSDLPPLEDGVAAARLAELCPTVVLVLRAGRTSIAEVRDAVDVLGRPVPVILNQSASAVPRWMRSMLGS